MKNKLTHQIWPEMLEAHQLWLYDKPKGRRIVLKDYDATGFDFGGGHARLADFSGMLAVGANFSGMDGRGADMSKIIATDADFSGGDFSDVDFSGANLCGVDFSASVLEGACFANAKAKRANFTEADATDATFLSIDASGAEMVAMRARGAAFHEAIIPAMDGVDLLRAKGIYFAMIEPEGAVGYFVLHGGGRLFVALDGASFFIDKMPKGSRFAGSAFFGRAARNACEFFGVECPRLPQ